MLKVAGALAVAAIAAGCGGTTRIVRLDPDRYRMTVYSYPVVVGSGAQLLERSWKEAADLCAREGKVLQPYVDAGNDPARADLTAYAELDFRCVEPSASRPQGL